MIRIAAAALAAALTLILPGIFYHGTPASAAAAISPACAGTPFCQGYELKAPDLALAVLGGTELSGTPLIAATASVDPAQDFYVHTQPAGHGVYIESAPSGVRSGLCVSEPDVSVRTAIVLRHCHANSKWQTWRREDTGSLPYRVLVNRASGLAIADPDHGGNGTQLVSRHPGFGTAGNELWKPVP